MRESFDQLDDYLVPEESLVTVSTGNLYEQSSSNPMTIGITDRRLVFVADNGQYMTVGHDAIRTIRSHPLTTRTYRGIQLPLLLGSGALLVLLGIVSVIALTTNVLVPLLVLVTVGGVVVAEHLRRDTDGLEWGPVTEITANIPYDLDGKAVRERYGHFVPDETQVLLLGSGVVALLSFIGLLLLVPSGFVVLGVLVTISGLTLVDYTLRHEAPVFDSSEIVRHHMTEVSISIQNDNPIHVRSDRSQELGQKLSRAVFMDGVEPSYPVSSHASSDSTDG